MYVFRLMICTTALRKFQLLLREIGLVWTERRPGSQWSGVTVRVNNVNNLLLPPPPPPLPGGRLYPARKDGVP